MSDYALGVFCGVIGTGLVSAILFISRILECQCS